MSDWHASWRRIAGAAAVGCLGGARSFMACGVAWVAGLDAGKSVGVDVSQLDSRKTRVVGSKIIANATNGINCT